MDMIVLSTEMWGAERQARKELLYKALLQEKLINSILYIEPMHFWWRGQNNTVKYHTTHDGKARIHQWLCPLPGERFSLIQKFNRRWQAHRIRNQLKEKSLYTGVFYHPSNWLVAKHLPQVRWYFDWTEDWGIYQQSAQVADIQVKAIRESAGVLTVSESLYEKACEIRGGEDDVLLLPNATALRGTEEDKAIEPYELEKVLQPRIGLLGHIGPWMDGELIVQLAQANKAWQWCVLGDARGDVRMQLDTCKNVHLLGIHAYEKLPNFMAYMDVLVAPYNNKAQGDSSKLYDYLTSGKPIVSSELDTARRLSEVVRIAKTPGQWIEAIQSGLNEKDDFMSQKRKDRAKLCSWQAQAEAFVQWISLRA